MARLILLAALAVDALAVVLFVVSPSAIVPSFSVPASPLWLLIPAIGVACNLVGLGLMIRIYRADPEGQRSWWRFDRS